MTVVHGLAARYSLGRDDVTTVELARYLGVTKQSTSEVVTPSNKPASCGARRTRATAGRGVLLLTDEGAAKLEDGRGGGRGIEDEWAELVGRDQLDACAPRSRRISRPTSPR